MKVFNLSRWPPITNLASCMIFPVTSDFKARTNRPGNTFSSSGMSSFRTTLNVPRFIRLRISSNFACAISGVSARASFKGIISVIKMSSLIAGEINGDNALFRSEKKEEDKELGDI